MSGVIAGALAVTAATTAYSAYNQNRQAKKAAAAQSQANALAQRQQKDAASKAEQEQNRVNKQSVNAGSILGSMFDDNYASLTGGTGINPDDLLLGSNTLLGINNNKKLGG